MQIDKVLLLLQYTTLARGSSNTARHGVITVREKTHQRGGGRQKEREVESERERESNL